MNIVYIYGLVDPRDGLIYYIGKTSMGLKDRLRPHIYKSKKRRTPKERWINSLISEGYQPLINELARLEKPTDAEVAVTEQAWIDLYQLSNPKLTNVGFGGQGGSGSHRLSWTPELDALLGKVSDSDIAQQLGCDRKSVAYRREKLGISRCPQTNFVVPPLGGWNRIDLPDEIISQLGKVSDSQLARQAGVCSSVVGRHRVERGIASYGHSANHPTRFKLNQPHPRWYSRGRIELPGEVISQLGKVSDCRLADQTGVHKSTIRKYRIERGIASYSESVNHPTRFKTGQPHPRWN
jgi:hypothetical protein